MKIKQKIETLIQKIADKVNGNGVMQAENTADGEKKIFEPMPPVALKASEESIVLLKNKDNALPIQKTDTVSVFGRCQLDYFYVGYGSGGDVLAPYNINLIDGLKNTGVQLNSELLCTYEEWCKNNPVNHGYWGHWPMCYPEMKLSADAVSSAAKSSNTALVVLGRAAGEDRENKLEKGSYYLTDTEIDMLDLVTASFDKVTVIMNCGNIIDMSWVKKYGDKISALLYAWQCGMESGNALANVLTGKVSPSGKLPCTIAENYNDYPSSSDFGGKDFNNYTEDVFVGYRYFETFDKEKALYPFGFGLSYTDFEITPVSFKQESDDFSVSVNVKNIGSVSGKEVVQLYVCAPQGKLSKASRSLVAFAKTKELAPNESEEIKLSFHLYDIASFDDKDTFAYVIEQGEYVFYVGNCVRTQTVAGSVRLDYKIVEQLEEICTVQNSFDRIIARSESGRIVAGKETVSPSKSYIKERIIKNLPDEIGFKGDKGYKLSDVADGKITLDDFVSQLNNKELEALTRGQGMMDSDLGVVGNAGAFGGIIPELRDKGVQPIITTDGPAGIRIRKYTSLIPCGTALASTFNCDLVKKLTSVMGAEMVKHQTDVLLAPGMNIQRNVLCGRNFEYFSEDPVLSGKMGAAYVNGIQSNGVSACPKHFACNNQEVRRTKNDSRVSQRALREIYLKGFEICVKESNPLNIMTSYNKINGVWSHYNYDLVTTVLRGEWGYTGNVMTDWWMQKSASPEFPNIKDNAYRVRAQVDVYMPGDKYGTKKYKSDGTLLKTLGKADGITRAELERTAKNVLSLVLKLKY
ncbi:MAG: glycoside hydrolase family 3 C-terminal domain-containing protein [Eubacterium sp.]|nr:glycoside hydrolase family 3 C-terminal domain-containing protein [Eubacterium sp.]